jgi:Ca2+:H+ antiporter
MASSERAPLLGNGNGSSSHSNRSFVQKIAVILRAEGEPSWGASYSYFLFSSWINILLVFVPLSMVAQRLNWDAGLQFLFSFIAIMPLAKLLGDATEQMSSRLGQTLAGLLNASFGNAVEIIVGIAALLRDEIRIVQTSMLGSILSNLLLVLGCSFFAGGLKFKESNFQVTAAQASSSLMTLACITLVIPAAYHSTKLAELHSPHNNGTTTMSTIMSTARDIAEKDKRGLLIISRGTALLLLMVYAAYLVFQLHTHKELFEAPEDEDEEPARMSTISAASSCVFRF